MISFRGHLAPRECAKSISGSRATSGKSSASADISFAQAISDTLHADECADWIARDALRRDRPHPPARHRALPRIAWAVTVAVVVLGVAELVELVGALK